MFGVGVYILNDLYALYDLDDIGKCILEIESPKTLTVFPALTDAEDTRVCSVR